MHFTHHPIYVARSVPTPVEEGIFFENKCFSSKLPPVFFYAE
jgi:hypothetical protein